MPLGVPNTSVTNIWRNLSPCLLHLPGELLNAGNCSQFIGALLQNRPEVFSGTGLCAIPRSNISHPEKEEVVVTPILRLFGRAQGISTRHEDSMLASGKIVCAVTSHHNHSHLWQTEQYKHAKLCLSQRQTPLQIGLKLNNIVELWMLRNFCPPCMPE